MDRQRTRKRGLARLRELGLEAARREGKLHLAVAHAAVEEEAHRLANEMLAELSPVEFILGAVGPGLGVHSGPGAMGVCVYAGL